MLSSAMFLCVLVGPCPCFSSRCLLVLSFAFVASLSPPTGCISKHGLLCMPCRILGWTLASGSMQGLEVPLPFKQWPSFARLICCGGPCGSPPRCPASAWQSGGHTNQRLGRQLTRQQGEDRPPLVSGLLPCMGHIGPYSTAPEEACCTSVNPVSRHHCLMLLHLSVHSLWHGAVWWCA
jgi:hypothetical protein